METEAWVYRTPPALDPVRGVLRLAEGRLSFRTAGDPIERGMASYLQKLTGIEGLGPRLWSRGQEVIFDEELSGLGVEFPRSSFGATLQLTRGGTLFRIAFFDPRDGLPALLRRGRREGRPWKERLS